MKILKQIIDAITSVNIGVYFMLISVILSTMRDTITKTFIDLPAIEVVFFANIIGMILIKISMISDPPVTQSLHGNKRLLIFRGVVGFFATSTIFYLIMHIPFVNAILFAEMQVLFSAVFMYFHFLEKLSKIQILAIMVGFIGIILIVFPQNNSLLNQFSIIGIICALTHAMAFVSVRELRRHYESKVIAMSFLSFSALGALICMILAEFIHVPMLDFIISKFVMPDFKTSLFLLLIGIFATLVQIYKVKAYLNGKMGIIGVTAYSRVAFAFIVGILLGDHIPDIIVGAGIILVTLSGIMVSYHNYPQKTKDTYQFK